MKYIFITLSWVSNKIVDAPRVLIQVPQQKLEQKHEKCLQDRSLQVRWQVGDQAKGAQICCVGSYF